MMLLKIRALAVIWNLLGNERGRQLRRPYRMPSCVIARAESCAASWTPVCAILMLLRDHFR
jgi:hypothetical protein